AETTLTTKVAPLKLKILPSRNFRLNLFSNLRSEEEGLLPESHKKRNIVAVNRLLPEGQN
ncbi:hypothetical protein, partial [Klebsiella pneumoniae]|uniref:hypothetical protein n=1 Tax=Klebsiella pneumoniae TaxID=573 RepID=UPI002731F80A